MRLKDKTVIVTGGGHGIGRAYARGIAREGGNVVVLDIDGPAVRAVADEICREGGEASAIEADVRDFGALKDAAAWTARTYGAINGAVNNAGLLNVIPISRVMFEEIAEEEWDHVFDVNIKGMWHSCKAWVPYLREAGGGSIVNIASSTVFLANPTRAHYVASKGAVVAFSRVLSRELGPNWIRVNVVCPGSTLSEENPDEEAIAMRNLPIATRSLKRVELPEDMVGTILYLLSDDSAFMTGQTLVVEGGGVLH
jgi:3-oxoacyl-[acyl-carrier protein] reductase